MANTQKQNGFVFDFTVGSGLGILSAGVAKVVSTPIERLASFYVIPEDQLKQLKKGAKPPSFLITIWYFLAHEGVFSLFRGILRSFPGYIMIHGLAFGFTELYQDLFDYNPEKNPYWMWVVSNFGSGMLAGATTSLIVQPLNHINGATAYAQHVQQQKQPKKLTITPPPVSQTLDNIMKTHGIQGLYRGSALNATTTSFHRTLYFGLYYTLKPSVLSYKLQDSFIGCFLLAWATTSVASIATYPLEQIRRRGSHILHSTQKMPSVFSITGIMFMKEGSKSFFKGATKMLPIRTFAGAVMMAFYDRLQHKILRKR